MATRERKARTKIDTDNLAVVFEFGSTKLEGTGNDEKKVFAVESIKTYSAASFTPEIKNQLMLHGLKQKLGDSFADPNKNPQEAADEVYQNLSEGNFNGKSDGLGGIVVEAFARLKNIELEEASRRWNAASDEVRKNTASSPLMVKMVSTIRAERADKKSEAQPDANNVLDSI